MSSTGHGDTSTESRAHRHEESITHTHRHTHSHTDTLYAREICSEEENAWTQATARYDGKSHVSCAKCRSKLKPPEESAVNVASRQRRRQHRRIASHRFVLCNTRAEQSRAGGGSVKLSRALAAYAAYA